MNKNLNTLLAGVATAGLLSLSSGAMAGTSTAWVTAGPTTAVAGAMTFDFGTSPQNNTGPVEDPMTPVSFGIASFTGGELFNATPGIGAVAARPAGSTGNYWVVEPGETGTISFSTPVNYFGFLWGSPDPQIWNELTIYSGSTVIAQFDGSVTGLSNAWTSAGYFNFFSSDAITSVTITAGRPAFELDNVAFAVPEPGEWAMMLAGLGIMGSMVRRRSRNV